jgi:hypothetical protein
MYVVTEESVSHRLTMTQSRWTISASEAVSTVQYSTAYAF